MQLKQIPQFLKRTFVRCTDKFLGNGPCLALYWWAGIAVLPSSECWCFWFSCLLVATKWTKSFHCIQ